MAKKRCTHGAGWWAKGITMWTTDDGHVRIGHNSHLRAGPGGTMRLEMMCIIGCGATCRVGIDEIPLKTISRVKAAQEG